jgi:hypothetical protein
MSRREWRYQIKLFKPLLEKRGRTTTKDDNASSKHLGRKKTGLLKDSEYKST